MSGKLDQISDKVKETTGEVFGDSKLKTKDVIQQGISKIREAVAGIEEKTGDVLKKNKEETEHLVDETEEKAENLVNNIKSKF